MLKAKFLPIYIVLALLVFLLLVGCSNKAEQGVHVGVIKNITITPKGCKVYTDSGGTGVSLDTELCSNAFKFLGKSAKFEYNKIRKWYELFGTSYIKSINNNS